MGVVESRATAGAHSTMAHGGDLALKLFVVALAYYSAGRLGLLLPYVGSHVSLVWLPTGIAVAAYWRWGGAMTWAVWAAAALVNYQTGGPGWMSVGIALGNTLGPWVSTVLLRRWSFDPMLTRRRDLGVYVAAVMLGMVVTASNGTLWLRAADLLPAQDWASAWMTWWIGDGVGALLGGVPLITLTRATLRDTFGGRGGMLNGALLGALCYATYDLTNQATMKVWPASITAIDIAWGAAATALASGLAAFAVRKLGML